MSSTATSPGKHPAASTRDLGVAWVLLCVATAAHVTDEALTGFLSVYNPTVVALRAKLGFWPRPTFEFRDWLTGLILAVIIRWRSHLWCLVDHAASCRSSTSLPSSCYCTGWAMRLNHLRHQTVSSIRFPRPMPGFYSSPLLLAAAIYALAPLRKTKRASA
jgi:hypothetical protein